MRSYGQYCSVAKALDAIGDRWSLLIARELLLREPCRYTDLQHGLPGIATNLLVDRLRELERVGVVSREEAPAPVASTVYRLTSWGRELEPVLLALGQWGSRLMAEPGEQMAFRSRWLQMPVQLFLADREPSAPPLAIELDVPGDEPMTIEAHAGDVRLRPGPAESPALTLSGPPQTLVGLLAGALELEDARARGLRHKGDLAALARLQPPAPDATQTAAA